MIVFCIVCPATGSSTRAVGGDKVLRAVIHFIMFTFYVFNFFIALVHFTAEIHVWHIVAV